MNLPPDFIQTIQSVFGEDGKIFLENLPNLIEQASTRWGLKDVEPVSNLSFNYVAFAKRPSTTLPVGRSALDEVVLKIGVPRDELISEMAALKLFNGNGACQLLDCDEERGFLLLERLRPGTMLSKLEDDDECTHIAVDVMARLWREIPAAGDGGLSGQFIKLSDWFDGLKKIRPHFNGGTGPFPKELLERVELLMPELFADKNVKLMHGDFHHFNVLKSERGWLVIDPKGVIGPVGYEIGPLMLNPWNSISDGSRLALPKKHRDNVSWIEGFKVQAERRVSILAERLGWERETIINWATAHAVLSAWWSIEDGQDWKYSLQCAEIFSGIK
jgi:streptomycin 6-kinase